MGYEPNVTAAISDKDELRQAQRARHTLLGNAWCAEATRFLMLAALQCDMGPVTSSGTKHQARCAADEPVIQGGPAAEELNAPSVHAVVTGCQPKRHTAPGGGEALLPLGLTPAQHFMCGLYALSPFTMPSVLPSDLELGSQDHHGPGRKGQILAKVGTKIHALRIGKV